MSDSAMGVGSECQGSRSTVTAVHLEDVGFGYRKGRRVVQVLRDFSLDVAAHEIVALLGESGSGKSTVLSLISGMNVPHSGSVEVLGVEVGALDRNRRAELRLKHIAQITRTFSSCPCSRRVRTSPFSCN